MANLKATRRPSPIVNRTVTPRRPPNADLREREYLTPKEVDRLQDAARKRLAICVILRRLWMFLRTGQRFRYGFAPEWLRAAPSVEAVDHD